MRTKSILDTTEWRYNPAWSLADELDVEIWADEGLSLKAKGIWGYMRSKPGNWDFSAKRISSESKDETKSIQRGMKELEDFGYLSKKKLGNGRVRYMLGSEPYVGVEPEIAPSPFEGLRVNMEHNSMYDGANDYKGADGSPQTVGEPSYKLKTDGEDKWDIRDVEGCDKAVEEYLVACSEGDVKVCEMTWEKWKRVYIPACA